MISEALLIRVEGRIVSHSWGTCVVSHAMVGWIGSGMEVVDGINAGQPGVLAACREMPENFPSTR